MTVDEFIKLLGDSGIPINTKDWRDYEEAKRWAGTVCEEEKNYERLVQVAAEYVGV
jgi:hypothetical protein